MSFAEVQVSKPLETAYTYAVPPRLAPRVLPGSRVRVPLGRDEVSGTVIALREQAPDLDAARIRSLTQVLEFPPALDQDLLDLGRHLAATTLCAPGEAYQGMVPSYHRPAPPPRLCLVGRLGDALYQVGGRARKQREVLEHLERFPRGRTRAELRGVASAAVLRSLLEKGVVEEVGDGVPLLEELPVGPVEAPGDFPALTHSQLRPLEAVREDLDERRHRVHLVHGVTGSGKTEIYLAAIRETLARGRGAILLIPEIALTVAMIEKIRERLGDLLAVLHSRQGARERYQEWARVRQGRARVVLGPRSAVFAPVRELGLILLDEEQEGSYKQQDKPRYHAREVALWRGKRGAFPVILGTATPTLESYHRACTGDFVHHRLEGRFRQGELPPVELVDMSCEFREKRNRSIFSMRLRESLDEVLEGGGQGLLFLNRRGYHTYVFCRTCGYVHECENCSVALTFHFDSRLCLCHHCAYSTEAPRICPACKGKAIRYAGSGTQRVAEEFGLHFPEVRAARMDSDTTRGKGAHARILGDFAAGRTQVLIGTQMLAKGFDFPHLHLVGVINADSGLTLPDFRGAEKTFQLLTQVAGRVGRGDQPGRVVVQTYSPDHYALQFAREHDYDGFAARELALREELWYPPFSRILLAVLEASEEERAREGLEKLRDHLEDQLAHRMRLRVLGPAPAPLRKLEGRYRQQLLVKLPCEDEAVDQAREVLRTWSGMPRGIRLDVDPLHLL